jgi:hypothetical protein
MIQEPISSIILIPLSLGIIAFVIATDRLNRTGGKAAIEAWSRGHHVLIVDLRNVGCFEKWFRLSASNLQTAYHATLQNSEGLKRDCWFVYGGWFLGPWTPRLEVRWIESFPDPLDIDSSPFREDD